MPSLWYVLEGHEPRKVNALEYALWRERHPDAWRVGGDRLDDGTSVSTVFLGLDHGWADGGPLLFETMVFGRTDRWDGFCWRYATWDEAAAGHAAVLKRLREGRPPYEDEEDEDA